MSWESTTLYYQTINREISRRLGDLHSAKINMVSLDFQDIAQRQRCQDWAGMGEILIHAARTLESGGADCLLIGTNTMHRLAPAVQGAVGIPLLHIADITADAIGASGLTAVGLLGTRFTMEQDFYVNRLRQRGIDCLIPDEAARIEIHRIIFEELCKGQILPSSRHRLQAICAELAAVGAQGVVLGCTELPLILSPQDLNLPIFDTTALHALASVDFALSH